MYRAIVFFAFLTTAFFAPVVLTNTYFLPIGSDFVHFNYPNDIFAAQSFQNGELPLWNPYVSAGQPYVADPNLGSLYPLRLLLTLTHFNYQTMIYLLMVHYFLAGIFTYALARDLGASRFGSLIAGTGFMFSGFLIAHMDHINIVISSTWLPLIFLMFRRAVLNDKVLYALIAGLALSLSVLGGHQQFSLFAIYWCAIWLLIFTFQARGYKLARKIGLFVTMLVVAIGASSIQILPTLEFFQHTQRRILNLADASLYNTIPTDWILLLFPHYLGAYAGQAGFLPNVRTNEFYLYAGVIILFGAFIGSYTWKSREKPFFLWMILLSVILSAGHLTPVFQMSLDLIPGMKYVRVPGRFVFWLSLSLPILCAFGADWILLQMTKSDRRLSRDTILISAFGVMFGLAFFFTYPMFVPVGIPPEITRLRLINSLTFSVLLVGLTAFLWIQRRQSGNDIFRKFFLMGLIIVDLFAAQWPRHITTNNVLHPFDNPEIVQFLDASTSVERISFVEETYGEEKWAPLSALIYGFYQDRGLPWNPFDLERFRNYQDAISLDHRFYNFLGVKYLIADNSNQVSEQWLLQLTANELNVYENSLVLPRAFMVHQSLVEKDADRALAMIQNEEFDPLNTVLLEAGQPASYPVGRNKVNITSISNNTMTIHVQNDHPGYLVVSDAFYPGWHVYVNGELKDILRANYAFRAVSLPSGESIVYFEFQSPFFVWGLGITLLTWLFALCAIIYLIKGGKHHIFSETAVGDSRPFPPSSANKTYPTSMSTIVKPK